MNTEAQRHAHAMTEAWIAAHAIIQQTYPDAHYEFSQAGPFIEIQLNATTGLVFGTCDVNIGADVDDIIGTDWEPTGTPIDTPVSSDSEDAQEIAAAILAATRTYHAEIRQSTEEGTHVQPDR